jgi:hypothetical protein
MVMPDMAVPESSFLFAKRADPPPPESSFLFAKRD